MRLRSAQAGTFSGLVASLALVLTASGLFAQIPLDPENRARLYQKPQAVIDPAVIAQLEQDLTAPAPEYDRIQATARGQLALFYSQFIDQKLTADERRDESLSYRNLSADALRRLILQEDMEYATSQFQGESPYLFRLHRILGRVYSAPEYPADPRRALREYVMALRYTGRPLPELMNRIGAIGTPVVPDAGTALGTATDTELMIQRERIYMAMLQGFADPDRVAQVTDAGEATSARNFRNLLEEYNRLKPELAEARRGPDVAEAARVRGATGVPTAAEARANLERAQTRFDQLTAELELIRTGPYRTYQAESSAVLGDTAYRMALLSRELELGNKARERAESRSSYTRGIGDQAGVDRTPHRDFPGYRMLLQLAHQVDPTNLTYLDLLTEDFRTSRRLREAIAFQERYLELALEPTNAAAAPEDLARHYLRLGGMYSDERNAIRAATAFQEYLRLAPAALRATPGFLQIQLGLADLHFEHTGRLAEAEDLYRIYLDQRPGLPAAPEAYAERVRWRAEEFRIQNNLAAIRRRNNRSGPEREALQSARTVYADLETEYEAAVAREREIQVSIIEVKRELLSREEPALQRRYYQLQRLDLPAAEARAGFLRSRLKALNIGAVLERLAFFSVQDRSLPDALSLYREIIARGDGAQITRARTNIDRINLTLGDGRLRKPLLDPGFER